MTARRPWWKKKRWVAAMALWVVVAYLLSVGPARYALARGWISGAASDIYMRPAIDSMDATEDSVDAVEDAYEAYLGWWEEIGEDHADSL